MYSHSEYNVSSTAPVIDTTPTIPLNHAKACHAPCVQRCSTAASEAKNQKNAAPTQVSWNPVFHLAGPIAAIVTPFLAAYCRNSVMKISRPSTIPTIQNGRPTSPIGVTNGYETPSPAATGPIVDPAAQA